MMNVRDKAEIAWMNVFIPLILQSLAWVLQLVPKLFSAQFYSLLQFSQSPMIPTKNESQLVFLDIHNVAIRKQS
jgi:hypothetical protein